MNLASAVHVRMVVPVYPSIRQDTTSVSVMITMWESTANIVCLYPYKKTVNGTSLHNSHARNFISSMTGILSLLYNSQK